MDSFRTMKSRLLMAGGVRFLAAVSLVAAYFASLPLLEGLWASPAAIIAVFAALYLVGGWFRVESSLKRLRAILEEEDSQALAKRPAGLEQASLHLRRYENSRLVYTSVLWAMLAVALVVWAEITGAGKWKITALVIGCFGGLAVDALVGNLLERRPLVGLRSRLSARWPGYAWWPERNWIRTSVVQVGGMLVVLALLSFHELAALRHANLDAEAASVAKSLSETVATLKASVSKAEKLREDLKRLVPSLEPHMYILDAECTPLSLPQAQNSRRIAGWLKRACSADSGSWRDFRTPFPFVRAMARGKLKLYWAGPEQPPTVGWDDFFAWWLPLILLAVLAITIFSFRAEVRDDLARLSRWISSVARGDVAPESWRQFSGDLENLCRTVAEGFERQRQMAAEWRQRLEQVARQIEGASEQVEAAVVLAEESEKMEQTATSLMQMRSSIKSIGEQLEALRDTSSDTSSTMLEIDQSIREVAQAAENLQQQVEDTASAMAEITLSIGEVLKRIENLNQLASESTHAANHIDESVGKMKSSTEATRQLSQEVTGLANRGVQAVAQTIDGITEIQQVTTEAESIIQQLGNRMVAVGKILTVIGDVAEQTNLLALNAAIIAAAAGESGKAFAVVADEIKDLADRTSSSTKEIAGLIKQVQKESRQAVEVMQRGSNSVRRGVELAQHAGEALTRISEAVEQVNEMTGSITRLLDEHTSLTSSISASMGKIGELVAIIKRAVAEQSEGGSRISKAAEQMRDDSRFVRRATEEQVRAIEGASRNMERIANMLQLINRAMNEQTGGIRHLGKVTEELASGLQKRQQEVGKLKEMLDRLVELSAGSGTDGL